MLIVLQISKIFKIIQILLLSGIKFILAPPLALKMGFNYFQTILMTTIGGIVGVAFFFFISQLIISLYVKYYPVVIDYFKLKKTDRVDKKIFTKKNRMIINIMNKFGLRGIIIFTPILFSIPLGTFIAARFFSKPKHHIFLYLALSVIVWSFIMSTAFFITYKHF